MAKIRPQGTPHRLPKNKRREAQGAGGEAWWYEDERGIDVYQHTAPGVVTSARIPWRLLLNAAKRCGYLLD